MFSAWIIRTLIDREEEFFARYGGCWRLCGGARYNLGVV